MTKQNTQESLPKLAALTLLATLIYCLYPATIGAQATLQPSTQGTLQQQTGQGQNTANTQNQKGTLQDTPSQPVLHQGNGNSLGVVSDPRQSRPEVTVAPSKNLKTDISKSEGIGIAPYIAISTFALAVIGVAYLYLSGNRQSVAELAPIKSEGAAPAPRNEDKPKKTRKTKRKRKKPHQR